VRDDERRRTGICATAPDRYKQVAVGLAAVQVVDTIGNAILPRRCMKAHLDHLRVPHAMQPVLPVIKLATSAGLLVGLEMPRLGVLTSAALVGYYAAAAGFHMGAGDHPVFAAPAAVLAAGAAVALVAVYLPPIRQTWATAAEAVEPRR
jgi:hypothetical protein